MGGENSIFSSFGTFAGDQGVQAGMSGAFTGIRTGMGIGSARYNANAADAAAKNAEQQSRLNAYLIQKKYEADYRALNSMQEQNTAEKQVLAAKRGITGASANNAMQTYAAKDQRNKESLYYNAAMQTGNNSIQASREIMRQQDVMAQYRWQAVETGIGGAMRMGTSLLNIAQSSLKPKETPPGALDGAFKRAWPVEMSPWDVDYIDKAIYR